MTRNARMASNGGRYYDSKKQRLDMNVYHFDARTISIQGEKITWSDANGREYEAEIQMTKGGLVPDQNVFGHSDFLTLRVLSRWRELRGMCSSSRIEKRLIRSPFLNSLMPKRR